jgi:hypothetical protein
MSARICPPRASDGAVRKNKPLSSKVVKPGDVADGDIITTPFGTATLLAIAPVTPEQSAPIIAATPCDTKPSAADVAAAESTQVESASKTVTVSPPRSDPESEASLKASLAESLIAGVRDSIGPVNPKMIPILISAKEFVVNTNKDIIAAINSFFIFSLIIILLVNNSIYF